MHAAATTWAAQVSAAEVAAAESTGGSGGGIGSFLPLVLLVLAFYLLILRPQRARARATADVQRSLAVGAEVLTTSGMYARVVDVDGTGPVTLEIAPGVAARFSRAAVVRVLPAAETGTAAPDADETDPPA